MSLPDIPFVIVGLGFAGLGAWMIFAAARRAAKSQTSWGRTEGRITTFRFHYGAISVSYEYNADGRTLEGNKIYPGATNSTDRGSAVSAPRSVYLRPDGSLRLAPGAAVEVFYDPKNPPDSALLRGTPPTGQLIYPVIVIVFGLALAGGGLMAARWPLIFPILIIGASLAFFRMGVKSGVRYARSKQFPSVTGRLLKAELASTMAGADQYRGLAFVPQVEFEYDAGGAHYQSQQLNALAASVDYPNPGDAQRVVDNLKANPDPLVYYDPRRHGMGF